MKKYMKIINIAVIICIMCFVSCGKSSTEKKLQGTWKKIDISNMSSPDNYVWVFEPGYYYILHQNFITGQYDTTKSRSEYQLQASMFKKTIVFPSGVDTIPDDKWKVEKLTKSVLVLYRETYGIEYLEFEKQ